MRKLAIYNHRGVKNFVSTDWHLGHKQPFIWQKRGYNSVDEHDTALINKVNELVGPDDNLFYLGDFCLNTDEARFESYLDRINCQNIHLIWGNHPNPIRKVYDRAVTAQYQRDDIEVYPFRYRNLNILGYQYECVINGKYVVLNHFPISVWENMKEGSYMLCGHSHYSYPATRAEAQEGLTLDCGWDGHARPLLFDEIIEIMNKKQVRAVDHHVKDQSR
jgi:calcineurin-like phosphoesterase family protein